MGFFLPSSVFFLPTFSFLKEKYGKHKKAIRGSMSSIFCFLFAYFFFFKRKSMVKPCKSSGNVVK